MAIDVIAYSGQIDKAFKSLIKSGRPDIFDEDRDKSVVPELYVDLYENDYVLNQVLDENHTLLQGRRGTGKSTIFLKAEYTIKDNSSLLPVYINLQTCYEEIRSSKTEEISIMSSYLTYKNFLTDILKSIKQKIINNVSDEEFDKLFSDIEQGKYINQDFERTIQVTSNSVIQQPNNLLLDLENGNQKKQQDMIRMELQRNEYRLFSIHEILKKIKELCLNYGIHKIYLFLDDFSELTLEAQKVVVDSLVAPIVSSYNETFIVKIAAYPGRIYLGDIDKTKLPSHSLDFYDAYDQSSTTYNNMESYAISYLRRALEKRLNYYTEGKVSIEDLFQLDDSNNLNSYLTTLFNCSVGILRSLGFVLSYCFLSSFNNGSKIRQGHIESAAQKYYEENILSDFINDARFKQSFYDDKTLLDQIAQKNLHDKIIQNQFQFKREIIEKHRNAHLKNSLFMNTLEKYRKGTIFYFPTSHFSIDISSEKLLRTLELYLIINKFHEPSKRDGGKKVAIYGLNYGLCLKNGIDYGRPAFRRTYDYWRQDEFNLTDYIHEIISSIEVIKCLQCEEIYSEEEYEIYLKRKNCFACTKHNTVSKVNKFETKLKQKLQSWSERRIPDSHMDILRVLYNNRTLEMSAFEIAQQIDRHHIVVTNSIIRSLYPSKLVEYREENKRYYKISEEAISIYFSEQLELLQ